MPHHGHCGFFYKGHKERRTGKIRGCWFARRLHQLMASTTMDLGISVFLTFVQCVALRNLDLLIKTGGSVICPLCCRERWSSGDNVCFFYDTDVE